MKDKEIIKKMKETGKEVEINSYYEDYDLQVPGGWISPNYETRRSLVTEKASFAIITKGVDWFMAKPDEFFATFPEALTEYISCGFSNNELHYNGIGIISYEEIDYNDPDVENEIDNYAVLAIFHPMHWEIL